MSDIIPTSDSAAPALREGLADLMPSTADIGLTADQLAAMTPVYRGAGPKSSSFTAPSLFGGGEVSEISGVPLTAQTQRVRWEPDSELGEAPPTCRSADGETGQGEFTGGVPRQCATCPAALWHRADGTPVPMADRSQQPGDTPPECSQRLAVLIDVDEFGPAIVDVPPSSLGVMRTAVAGVMMATQAGRPGWFSSRVTFTRGAPRKLATSGQSVRDVVMTPPVACTPEEAEHAQTIGADAVRAFRSGGEVAGAAPSDAEAPSGAADGPTEV